VNDHCHHVKEVTVKFSRFIMLTLVAGLVLGLLAPLSGFGQPKIPEPFQFPQGKDSPGVVTFDHAKHVAAGNDKCTACHVKIFKMKKGATGTLSMAKMKAGEQCGACHNGKTEVKSKTVFLADDKANCEKCHKK
jgi:c(7)-type cytochrome triheme protein